MFKNSIKIKLVFQYGDKINELIVSVMQYSLKTYNKSNIYKVIRWGNRIGL